MEESKPITMYEDNTACISMIKGESMKDGTQYVTVNIASAKEKFKNGLIDVVYCNTENMIADVLTKLLNKNRFVTLREKLGLLESQ